ncbi:ABC transporter substrate-binding protein [Flavobacterium piscinae]|uniref:Cobalamin-binding protein n=1 Tax=Flavobacterium piscinae TaxID=2506424 RepID=A0A4Q1KLH0_9FLAO|nr:helical backbone metal receptor [Flavobacterium piscinae]MBC8884360.1 ABC transporter substrate-binding protein [Flavobacterium piscinae]RXR30577.1 cobalamin-binding protein [Flavobacterium piscinae]
MNCIDQLGIEHSFKTTPKRIISLVPSQTELLYDLGLEEEIVGITKFCVHPNHLKATKQIIGGTKQVKFDKIEALQPDIIIANKEENTKEIVKELSKICPVWVTNIVTIEDNLQMIADFGKLFNKRTEAQKWNDKITFAYHDFQQFIKDKPFRKVAYFIWANPYMVAGKDTFINEMLTLNRFQNIYVEKGRYPEIELEKIRKEGDPEVVFLSSEPFPFKDEHAFEIGRNTHHAKTIFVDGEMFSWYGSRLLKAFDYFKQLHQKL